MRTGKVAILNMDEIANDVRIFLIKKCQESIKDLLNDVSDTWMTSAKGITAKDEKGNYIRQKDLIQAWCDYCSVKFFETSGDDIDEVLVDITIKVDTQERIWLASFR